MSSGWRTFQRTGEVADGETKKLGLLVVDDEQEIVEALRDLFAEQFRVFGARTAAEALELFREHSPELVVSDQRMPDVSGLDLLVQIKERAPETVRILITGYSDINVVIRAVNEGLLYLYLTKPWDREELRAQVLRAADHYQAVRARASGEPKPGFLGC